MPLPVIQPAFASGELSPALYGRVDLGKWHAGAAMLRNFFIDAHGGASNRSGTGFVGPAPPGGAKRAIPFIFSTEQAYMLIFADHKMYVVMDGALVLEDTPVAISGLATNPFKMNIVFSIPPAPVWNAGDFIYIAPSTFGVPATGIMSRFAGNVLDISSVAGTTYTIAEAATGAEIDGTPYVGGAAFIYRVYCLVTPYAAADLALLKFTQSADTMTICHPDYPTQILTRTAHNAWTITPTSFAPTLPAPITPIAHASTGGGTTTYRYVVTAIGANGVTESLPSTVAEVTNSKPMSATPGAYVQVDWLFDPTQPPQLFNLYRQSEVRDAAPATGQLYGFVGTVAASGPSQFIDQNIAPDFTRTPPQDPGILESVDNYAGCTNYFQQRQVFAGSHNQPETLYGSKTGDFYNMQYSSPARPNDAIVATLVSNQVNAVKHLIAMDALLAFTSNGAWKIDAGSQGGAITPSSLDATVQAYNGCSDVPPIIVNRDVLYVQGKGSAVRDLAYNDFVKIYTGSDLSLLSSHLFQGRRIVEWAFAEEPFKLIWCVRDDGVLLVFTYLKEQEVYAWTHCITDGQYKSVATIPEGNEDAVYFIVQRKVKGAYVQYIERAHSRLLGDNPELGVPADFTRFRFADSSLATELNYPAATLFPNDGEAQAGGGWWTDPAVIGAEVVLGGAGYTAPTAVIEDETGSGAAIVLTVLAGVITGANATLHGTGYSNPTVRIVDATGSGADVRALLGRLIELVSDAPVLTGVQVGALFVGNGAYGYVTSNNSARSITVDMRQQLANDFPMPAGTWSVTAKISTVHGLDHLEGREVTILADGNVMPNQIVTQGAVTLEAPAASVVVGLAYTARLESLYCDIPGESPTVQGRKKAIPSVVVRTQNTRGLKCGVKGEELVEFKERDTELMGDPITAYTGDREIFVPGSYDRAGQVVLQQDLPLPVTILALIPNVTVGDTPSA